MDADKNYPAIENINEEPYRTACQIVHSQMVKILLEWFPWLDSDEEVSGADTVEQLGELYTHLGGEQNRLKCSMCGEMASAKTAHLHQGSWIGDACCWDERLRSSE